MLILVPNVTDIGLKPRTVKKVAVISGGLMDSGIDKALIISNIFVIRKEVNSEYLLKGIKTVEDIRGMVARKKLAQSRAEKALTMIKGLLDYSEFKLELCGGNSDNAGFFSAEKPRTCCEC